MSRSTGVTLTKPTKSKSASRKPRKRNTKLKLKGKRLRRKLNTRLGVKLSPAMRRALFLIGAMLLVGGASGTVGYLFGHESLKGITQPALNPLLSSSEEGKNRRPRQGVSLLSETDIIKKLKSQNQSKPKSKASPSPKPSASPKAKDDKKDQKKDEAAVKLPVKAENQGMKLTVESLKKDEQDLVLNVALRNESSAPVKFVYNFLDVTDNTGQPLIVEVQGLPATFEPESDTFYGTVRIFDGADEKRKRVSLKLESYPDQTVKLEALNIPVAE